MKSIILVASHLIYHMPTEIGSLIPYSLQEARRDVPGSHLPPDLVGCRRAQTGSHHSAGCFVPDILLAAPCLALLGPARPPFQTIERLPGLFMLDKLPRKNNNQGFTFFHLPVGSNLFLLLLESLDLHSFPRHNPSHSPDSHHLSARASLYRGATVSH